MNRPIADSDGAYTPSTLTAKASASLEEQVEKELSVGDPEPEVAQAALEGTDEDTDKDEPRGED